MNINHLYRVLLALAATLVLTGCSAAPASHASSGGAHCVSSSHTSGTACATVQVRAAR